MSRPESSASPSTAGSAPASAAPAATPSSAAPSASSAASSRAREREEACVDRWLSGRKLDRFGHSEGTMYAGGTPLFDERTGEETDRLDYVYKKHPEARAACSPGTGGR